MTRSPAPTNYGAVPIRNDEETESAAPPSHVELATLTVPSSLPKKAAILHASKETTAALATESVEGGGIAEKAHIQAVVDLEKLSALARATDDEFVVGLHREATDHAFNPNDSTEIEEEDEDEDDDEEVGTAATATTVEKPLILSQSIRSDLPLEIRCFSDALTDTLHADIADMMDDAASTTTEENVHLGHDAFLLELPPQEGEKEHHFVLALPEIEAEELEEKEDDYDEEHHHHFPMLERAMTMMSTHLPTDIKDVQLEATAVASELHLDLVIKRSVPLIGYVILFFGFFALASAGAAFDLQGDAVTASMKTYWRLTSTVLLILPMVVLSLYRDGPPKLSQKEWLLLVAAAFCYAQMTTVFVVSLSMTSLANAFVFSNMTSLVIIVAKTFMGLPVLLLEASGAVIGIAGGVVCSKDTSAHGDGGIEHPEALLGNLIALSASFGTAAYLAIAKDLRSKCDLFVFTWSIFFISSFFVLAFMIITNEPVSFSLHPDHGLFGWMDPALNRLPLELFMAVVINVVGTLGYIAVLKYFDSIVVSVIMLMEPVVGVFIGILVGVDSLPGAQTWTGAAIVTLGSGLVVYAGSTKTESIDATKAVRPRSDSIKHDNNVHVGIPSHVEMLGTPVTMKRPSPKKRDERSDSLWSQYST